MASALERWMRNLAAMLTLTVGAHAAYAQQPAPPQPPSNLQAADHLSDAGDQIDLTWSLSSDDPEKVTGYRVSWMYAPESLVEAQKELAEELARLEKIAAADPEDTTVATVLRKVRHKESEVQNNQPHEVAKVKAGVNMATVNGLDSDVSYVFQVTTIATEGADSAPSVAKAISPRMQFFDFSRGWVAFFAAVVIGSIITFILLARSGMPMRVRRIPGLAAVEEAVGRATEMGRPVLFVNGTQDMNDMMTLAGLTVLSKVSRTVAEYDAKLEVPTSRSLVMTAARETVQASFLAAGRPDAYNQDLIYYVTDEQFGFVAYLTGHMVRQKPAACFYFGAFFAESLILAETGNAIGAIQIAGTAETAQLPFFVAACDYTLIGEEFFAASAYLSGEPNQLGSLRGQDLGKIVAAVVLVIGTVLATGAAFSGPQSRMNVALSFLKDSMLQ